MSKKKYNPNNPEYDSIFNFAPATTILSEPSQYDKGLLPGMDINEYRANQQSTWDKLGNGLFNMGTSAFTGALESTVGLGVGLASAIVDGKASSFYNNAFGEWIDSLNESAREFAPFYSTEEEQNMGLGESMGTANFWFDKVLGGAGYTLGSLATGYGLNSLFKLSTKAAAGMISSADDAMAVLNSTAKAASGIERLDMTKQFAIGMVMAHGESAMEARQTYDETLRQLTQARDQAKQGNSEFAQYANLTDEQIKKYSEDAANSNYLMNLAITGPTDMMLLGKWINPGTREAIEQYAKASERIGTNVVDGTVTYFDRLAKQKGRAFLKGTEAFLKGFATEGGQEGLQFASNVAAQEFVKNFQINDEGRLSSIISGLGEGLRKAVTTKEGLENILVGGITGGPFGMKGFKSQMEAEDLSAKQLIANLNSDVNFVKQGKEFGNIFGKTDTSIQTVADKIKSINNDLSIAERAKLENDLFEANNAEENALSQYIKMHIDKGTDQFLKEKLEMLKKASPEEMAQFFGATENTNPDKYAERIDKVLSRIDEYKKINDTLYKVYGISGGTKEQKIENQNLRDRLFFASVNIDNIQKRIESISESLKQNTSSAAMKGLSLINLRDMAINSVTNTSLDELNKQAKELGLDYTKYLKQYKDNAFKEYNNTLKKLLEDDPLKATEVIETLADLNRLQERKQHFVDYYNALNDPKKAKELLATEQKLQEKNQKKVEAALKFQEETNEVLKNVNNNDFFAVDDNRSNTVVIGDKEIDIAKLTHPELVNLKLSLEQDLKEIDKQVKEGNKTKEVLDKEAQLQNQLSSVLDELKFKGNEEKVINSYVDRLNKANSVQEALGILQEAQEKGVLINENKVQEFLQQLNKVKEEFENNLNSVEDESFTMNMNFKGIQEFSGMIFFDENARKEFETLKNQGDFFDKIEFIIEDNRDLKPDELRPIGKSDKVHPRLKKRIPPFTIKVIHKDAKETVLGYLPYYDQYWDVKENKLVVFESLNEQQFRNIFAPGKNYPDYTLEQMKSARLANKAIYDKIEASGKQRLNNQEVKEILDMELTRGKFNNVDPLQELTSLHKLPIHKINGVPVIVDISELKNGGKKVSPLMGISTFDNDQQKVVFPELYNKAVLKLYQIQRSNVTNPLNSKYWALVEDNVGQVEHEGKKYTWIPVTSNQLSTEQKKFIFDKLKEIRNKLIANEFKTEQEYKDALNVLNSSFFLSMYDTSGHTTDQKAFLVVSKGSDKVPVGNVALKIEYKVNGQKGEDAWFNFDINKVNSFDEMIAEVEKLRIEGKGKARQNLSGLQPLIPRNVRENLGKFDLIDPSNRDVMSEFGAMVQENYLIKQSILFNGKVYNTPPSKPKSDSTKPNPIDLIEEDEEDGEDVVDKVTELPFINPKDVNDEPSGLPPKNEKNTLVLNQTTTRSRRGNVDPDQKPNNVVLNRANISLATPVSYVQAIEDIKSMLPSFIQMEELSTAMQNISDGRITFGSFSNYIIRLANGIPNGTQFHEVFHAVFRTMLTNEQQDIIYTEGKNLLRKSLGSKSFNQAFKEFKAEHDEYAHIKSDEELESIFIEEFLADQFKDWMVNKEKSLVYKENKSKGLFNSLIDFFKKILNFAKWFDGNTDLLSLFSSIETGKFRDADVIRNRFTGDGRVLYSQIFAGNFEVDGEIVSDFLDANVQEKLINTIVSNILTRDTSLSESEVIDNSIAELAELFDLSNSRYDELFDGDNVKENYQREYHEIQKLYNALNIKTSIAQIKDEVNKTLKLYVDLNEDADEDGDGDNNITERSFDLNQENIGGFGSLSSAVRKYIGITTYESNLSDFFGFSSVDNFLGKIPINSAVNPKKVYDGLVKACANQQRPEQVLAKMNAIRNELHEGKHFLNKFFEEAGLKFDSEGKLESYNKDKYALIQRVVKAFNLEYKNYVFTQVDNFTKQFNTFNANQQDVHTKQSTVWKGNFISNKIRLGDNFNTVIEQIETLNNEIGKFNGNLTDEGLNSYVEKYQLALNNFGINLSKGYLKYLILTTNVKQNQNQKVFASSFEDLIQTSGKTDGKFFIESLDQIIKSVREGVNPFERAVGLKNEELGNLGRILRLAKDNAIFDENVYIVTLRNAEGKTIYPYQTPNYNSLALTRILSGDPGENTEAPIVDYLEDNYLNNNMLFAEMNTNGKVVVERIEGIKQASLSYDKTNDAVKSSKQGDGVTYGSMTERELALKQLALFADSNTDVKIRDSKGNITRIIPARRLMFTIMEASNTADTILLPLHEVVTSNGRISNIFKDFIYGEIQREYKRIKNVTEGKYTDQYKDFNIGKKRGASFWENSNVFIGERGNEIKEQLESLQIKPEDVQKELYEMIEKSFMNEFEDFINRLDKNNIIEINKKGEINNVLLDPRYFGESGINGTNPFKDISDKNVRTNLLYFYLNNYMNSMSFNQLLQGDPALTLKNFTDWFKRAKGSNAAGPNMLSFDESLNTPISVVTYAEIEGENFNEPSYNKYAVASLDGKSDKMIARYDDNGNVTPEWSSFIQEHRALRLSNGFSEEQVAKEIKAFEKEGKIDYNDAQCESTVEGFLHFKKLLGEMTPLGEKIYEKIKNGTFGKQTIKEQLSDWDYLKNNDLMANSIKLVYYDGFTYIKMSVAMLSPEFTTRPDGTAKKGKELLHKKRVEMEKNKIMLMGPPSMMKKLLKNPAQIKDGNLSIEKRNIQFIDPLHLKLQQKNPSNKTEIKDPSQIMQIIASEQNNDLKVTLPNGSPITIGEVVNDYNRLLSERVDLSYAMAKQFLYPLQNGNPTLNKGRLIKMFRETLETSGASQQLLDLLRTDEQGEPIHNFNLEHIVTQFEQQFNAYFNKVFVQKIPGYKTTLQSGYGYNVVVDKNTGRIIPSFEYDANPSKYDGDDYITRPLAFDQPRIINGNEIHRYSEIVLPYHFAEMFGLKAGDEIPEAIAYMFGTRIPSQDKHSAMVLKVVDVMPPYYGSNAIFPHELIKLTGSDFDIDSFYIHRMDHYYKDGEFRNYGNNKDSKWDQFLIYQYRNNKFFKKILREIQKHPDYKSLNRDEQIELALKELGLPSSEKEFNSSNIRTLGEINNDLLMNKMILHTNPGINDLINKMPVSLKIMEDYLTDLARILGYNNWEDIDKSYNPNSILGMLSAFTVNKAGQKAIGAAVNNTQVYTVLSQFGIKAKYPEGKMPVTFNTGDKEISAGDIIKGVTLTEDQRRIADVLTTLTSSMTDNPKYGYNSKMNVDINSLSTLSFLVSTHIPFEIAADLLQNEYVIKFIENSKSFAIKTQAEIDASSPQLIMEKLLDELKGIITKIDPFYSDAKFKELAQSPISLTELRDNIVNFSPMRREYRDGSIALREQLDNKKDKAYYESQYKILSAYSQLSTQGANFTTFSQIIKLTKGIASSDNQTSFKGDDEVIDNLAKLNLRLVKKGNTYDLEYIDSKADMMYDFKDIIKNHPITWKNLTIFADKQELAKQTFITKTDFARSIINVATATKKVNLNKKQRAKFSSELRRTLNAYLMIKALRHSESQNPNSKLFKYNSNALLYVDIANQNGITTLDQDQIKIKADFPEFKSNIWLQQVNFKRDGNNIKASYNTMNKGSVGFERMIISDFDKLFRDPRTKDFAIKSFEYLIAHSALRFRNNSFVSILPEYMFIKLSKHITDFHNTLNNPNDLGFKAYFGQTVNEVKEEFLNNFFRDIHNQEFIIPLQSKQNEIKRKITVKQIQDDNLKGDNVIKIENNKLSINPFINNKGLKIFHPDVEDQQDLDSLKKENLLAGFGKLKSMFDVKRIILPDGKSGSLFRFPKFISVEANSQEARLYRLDSYKNDLSKNELTDPDQTGNYWGLIVDYVLVNKIGDKILGAVPYGRTNKENEEVNTSILSQKFKQSQENAEDKDEEDDDDIDPSMLPTNVTDVVTQLPTLPILNNSINIYSGSNENADLSNFAKRPFEYAGKLYQSVEHAYQSLKSGSFDQATYNRPNDFIGTKRNAPKNVNKSISSSLMKSLIETSFQQNSKALERLLSTGNATLTHFGGNDKFWESEFPKLLMEVREKLKPKSTKEDVEPSNLPPKTASNTLNISLLSTSGGNDLTRLKSNGYQFFNFFEKTQDSFATQDILNSIKKILSLPANASFDVIKESYNKLTDAEKVKEINKIFCK